MSEVEMKKSHGGTLEVPSGEVLVARKCVLVESLLGKGTVGDSPPEASGPSSSEGGSSRGRSSRDKKKKCPIRKMGPSSLLGRVKEFLPQMKESNEVLLQKAKTDPSAVSVETPLQDDTQQHVEVSVALVPNEAESSDSDTEEFNTGPATTLVKEMTSLGVNQSSTTTSSPTKKALIMEIE